MPEKNRNRGKIMKRRECASLIILALAAVPALLVAIGQVYVTGVGRCVRECLGVEVTVERLGESLAS